MAEVNVSRFDDGPRRRLGLLLVTAILLVGVVLATGAVAQPAGGPPGQAPASTTVPVQLHLRGLFEDGSINLFDTILAPRSYTVSDGHHLRLTYVSCRAISNSAEHVQIFLSTTASRPGVTSPLRVVEFITEGYIEDSLPQRRAVAAGPVDAHLGVTTPDGPTIGTTLTLNAQRDTTQGAGGVECAVAGELTG